jgi:hypothetical protein
VPQVRQRSVHRLLFKYNCCSLVGEEYDEGRDDGDDGDGIRGHENVRSPCLQGDGRGATGRVVRPLLPGDGAGTRPPHSLHSADLLQRNFNQPHVNNITINYAVKTDCL